MYLSAVPLGSHAESADSVMESLDVELEYVDGVKVELIVNGNRDNLSGFGMNSEGLKDLAETLIPVI